MDEEIWRIAADAVRRHGERAGTFVRERIAAASEADVPTLWTWMTVVAAIDEILRHRPAAGERPN